MRPHVGAGRPSEGTTCCPTASPVAGPIAAGQRDSRGAFDLGDAGLDHSLRRCAGSPAVPVRRFLYQLTAEGTRRCWRAVRLSHCRRPDEAGCDQRAQRGRRSGQRIVYSSNRNAATSQSRLGVQTHYQATSKKTWEQTCHNAVLSL